MLTQDQIVRLQDIGFSACHMGAVYEARLIFDGLIMHNPHSSSARMGKALSHLVVDEFAEAESLLRALLADKGDDLEANTMLGLCFTLSGKHDEARELLQHSEADHSPAGEVARELLAKLK